MGLGDNTGRLTYLNIKKGKIAYKENGVAKESDFIEGFITKVAIIEKEYEGKKYEEANITIIDKEEKYQLQMKVDSGYFRAFCNAFKSGDPKLKTKITPTYEEKGAKKNSGCFVEQNGSALGWFYTKKKENMDEIPALESTVFGGKTLYDGTKLLKFWKDWLLSLTFKEEIEASSHSMGTQDNGLNKTSEEPKKDAPKKAAAKKAEKEPVFTPDDDDLPF